MARTRTTARGDRERKLYSAGPPVIPLYVYEDGATGDVRWSREVPKLIFVTEAELEHVRPEEGSDEDEGFARRPVRHLYDFHVRVRALEAADVVEAAEGGEEDPETDAAATAEAVDAWEKEIDECPRCRPNGCAKCRALEPRVHNGQMCRSFLALAKRTVDKREREAYVAAAEALARSRVKVRSHADLDLVDGEFRVKPMYLDKVRELLDECAHEGELKFEFEERLELRQVRICTEKNPQGVRAMYNNGSVFCPDRKSAHMIAEEFGIFDLPEPNVCDRCRKRIKIAEEPEHIEEASGSPRHPLDHVSKLYHNKYIRSLRHGYWIIDLDAVPHTVKDVPVDAKTR